MSQSDLLLKNLYKNKDGAISHQDISHPLLKGLYLIVDTNVITYPLEAIIEIINESQVNIVQYRNKSSDKKNIFAHAYKIKQKLNSTKLLIINDHIDVAIDLGDGIHLGQNDYPLERIHSIIPNHLILGISCHNVEEAVKAMSFYPSYIAIGCLFETKSKYNVIPVSLSELKKVCAKSLIPVCAIGGINRNNLDQVLTADIKMAALISYVWKTDNPLLTINEMHEKILSIQI